MVPEKRVNIKKCDYLKEKLRTDIRYCKKLAYSDSTPCQRKVKEKCLSQYHKIS